MSSDEEQFGDDENHPIPYVYACDINTVKKTGGSDLRVIIASPLKADARSRNRLLKKIENYLLFVNSSAFRAESGVPTRMNTRIVVSIHPDSDLAMFDLLERCRPWVEQNNATLVVERTLSPTSPTAGRG